MLYFVIFVCVILIVGLAISVHYLNKKSRQNALIIEEAISAFMGFIDAKDTTTNGHSKRVAKYTRLLARKMGFSEDEAQRMYYIGLMHDCGKIGIPDAILNKPAKLTDEEYEMIKQHAPKGGELIRQNMSQMVEPEFLQIAYDVATYHHEKWNGKGYPKGLSATEIPLSARIVAIADVFDALVAKRQYKEGMSLEKAVSIMEEERGKGFEPELLDTFIEDREDLQKVMDRLVTVHR